MIIPFEHDAGSIQRASAMNELESCNPVLSAHGLRLSAGDIEALVDGRAESLRDAGRVEFGGGVTRDLVLAFAGSPYVSQESFVDTILGLQDLFYDVKNDSIEQVADDELIAKMRSVFDDFASGDLAYLAEALIDGLGRQVREDDAAMNALTLAYHRYDVSRWVDETYSPAWDGASWLDE